MKDKNTQNEGAETPVARPSEKVRLDWRGFPIRRNWYDDEPDDGIEYIMKRDGSYSRVRL